MNNDLISREALKEQFTEGAYTSKGVREIIDNAPTVEAYTSEDLVKYISATEDLVRKKLERPQGTWKLDIVGPYCSECKTHSDYSSNFCPFCGADMRGGAK